MISEGKRQDVIQALNDVAQTSERLGKELYDDSKTREDQHIFVNLIEVARLAVSESSNINQPFRLGVVGMFKSGKSSVINTFLNRMLLKEGRTETTSVLTELRFAEAPESEVGIVLYKNDMSDEMSVQEALEYTDIRSQVFTGLSAGEKRDLQESIGRIILHLNCELLRTVTLLDTPGFGGSQTGDRKAFEALAQVDAALMIFSADRTGAENELEVADFLTLNGREIVVLLNKTDDGRGNPRSEDEISVAESFIREHFQTIVRDSSDKSLIFRYSAKEVRKSLELALDTSLSEEQQRDTQEKLVRWGYGGTGDSDAGKGVIAFIRDRYFSSASGAAYQRKLRAAKKSVLNGLDRVLKQIEIQRAKALHDEGGAKSEHLIHKQKLQDEIEPKIAQIEAKIDDIIVTSVQPFVRDMEDAIGAILDNRTDLDFSDLFKSFRQKNTIAAEIEREFKSNFPEWREQMLLDDIQHQVNRLLRNEWLYVFDQVQKIDPSVGVPDSAKIFEAVNKAVRGFAIALSANLAGWIAFMFIPGGALVGIVLVIFSDIFGGHYAARHKKKLQEAKNKIRLQMRNYAEKLSGNIEQQAKLANDHLADLARDSILSDLNEIELKSQAHRDIAERLRRVYRDLLAAHTILDNTQIESD